MVLAIGLSVGGYMIVGIACCSISSRVDPKWFLDSSSYNRMEIEAVMAMLLCWPVAFPLFVAKEAARRGIVHRAAIERQRKNDDIEIGNGLVEVNRHLNRDREWFDSH